VKPVANVRVTWQTPGLGLLIWSELPASPNAHGPDAAELVRSLGMQDRTSVAGLSSLQVAGHGPLPWQPTPSSSRGAAADRTITLKTEEAYTPFASYARTPANVTQRARG